jgi:hypothetical protein
MARDVFIRVADEAEHIANDLIAEHHHHLVNARILYLFTTAKRKKCDRVTVATAGKLAAVQRFLSSGLQSVQEGYDFIILIGHGEWGFLDDEQKVALVDHELCHCWRFEKEMKRGTKSWWGLRGHDVEEFTEVIARHGLWNRRGKEMGDVIARQLALGFTDASTADREPVGARR